jgi:serine/threonine-protein kinase
MKTCPLCDASYTNHHATCPTDGAILIESRELEPAIVIRGKYRIVRLVGRGGMGTVYLAEHIMLGRLRALKFISSELSRDATFLRRFRREAQAAVELQHPNIVQVMDLDQAEDGSPYIAMEYVDGPDLRHALTGEAFPVERALAIARGVALGLGAAHAKGIVHRDVKPENILLAGGNGAPEVPKLLDFGIAAMKESATLVSRTRGLMLTPEYAAPEQWKGMASEEMDGRVDLYALGGVLHEMLTGQTGFHSHNTEGWMYQHLQAEPQAPSRTRPELANWVGLDALVLRLLAKDRELRPRDAAEVVGLLNAVHYADAQPRRETVREDAAQWERKRLVPVNEAPRVSRERPNEAPPAQEPQLSSFLQYGAEPQTGEGEGGSLFVRNSPVLWALAAALLVVVFAVWRFTARQDASPSQPASAAPIAAVQQPIENHPPLQNAIHQPASPKPAPAQAAKPERTDSAREEPPAASVSLPERTVPVNPPKLPQKVNISAGVAVGMLLEKTAPTYPPIAKAARVSGTVILQATISKTGTIENLRVVSGPPMLQQAALDAVKTWRYRPYLLFGEPVEVETTVNVIFTLGG